MAIISLSGRTWVGNDTIDPSVLGEDRYFTVTLDFNCDGVSYTAMNLSNYHSAYSVQYVKSDGTIVTAAKKDGTWIATKYKTLTFPEGGNGHTHFATIRFLHENGTFTPEIEEMKDSKTVSFSFLNCPDSNTSSCPRLLIYPYSNDTKEALGATSIYDILSIKSGTIIPIPFYKDVIYAIRAQRTSTLTGTIAPSIDGELLQGFDGVELALNNLYRISGSETLVFDYDNFNSTATSLRWAFGLSSVTPSTITHITYDGKNTELTEGQTATLTCNGKKMKSDVVINFGVDGKIFYNGNTTEVEAGNTATLQCAGKKMKSDVIISLPKNSIVGAYTFSSVLSDYGLTPGKTYSFDFDTVRGIGGPYTGIKYYVDNDLGEQYISYTTSSGSTPAYWWKGYDYDNEWVSSKYRSITITSDLTDEAEKEEIRNWLELNRDKVGGSN